ncbi:MAG: hypothetical protein E6G11_01750 [Actinobacteria bacterium]|nr:MAG: hypothetical protein E6G11_01750 [Actinomycetota bacterium]
MGEERARGGLGRAAARTRERAVGRRRARWRAGGANSARVLPAEPCHALLLRRRSRVLGRGLARGGPASPGVSACPRRVGSSPKPIEKEARLSDILLVAATEAELCGHPGLVCGIGPVEAAVATARAIALEQPTGVLHVGVAGAKGITPGRLVIGTEAVYCDLAAEVPVVQHATPDPTLLATTEAALPYAVALPIGTSAAVDGPCGAHPGIRVEGMEGFAVLRACELTGTPAVEVRAVSNEIGEGDRARWQVARGIDTLAEVLPGLLAALRT